MKRFQTFRIELKELIEELSAIPGVNRDAITYIFNMLPAICYPTSNRVPYFFLSSRVVLASVYFKSLGCTISLIPTRFMQASIRFSAPSTLCTESHQLLEIFKSYNEFKETKPT